MDILGDNTHNNFSFIYSLSIVHMTRKQKPINRLYYLQVGMEKVIWIEYYFVDD